MTWDQWVILIFGPSAVALSYCPSTRHRMLGPVLGLGGQVAWFYTLYVHSQWGAFIAGFAYSTSWAYGAWSLRREYKCLFKNWIDRLTLSFRVADSTTGSSVSRATSLITRYLSKYKPTCFSSGCVKSTREAIALIEWKLRRGC